MKKLLSMLLVVAMIASMSLVAFAADSNVMSTVITETDAGITVTVKVKNPSKVSGIIASLTVPADKLGVDKTSYTLAGGFEGLNVSGSSNTKSGYNNVKYSFTHGSEADFVTATGDVTVITFPLTRLDDTAVFTSADFAYATGLYAAVLTYKGDGSVEMKSTNATYADYFVAPVYVDNRTPVGGGEEPEEPEEPETPVVDATVSDITTADGDWSSDFVYPTDKEGTTVTEGVDKKVVGFGKAAVDLAAEGYGIKIGNRYYPGKADVAAGKFFAIIVVDSRGSQAILDSYSYQVYVGDAAAYEANPETSPLTFLSDTKAAVVD